MEDFQSKYTGEQVEEMLDQIANGDIGSSSSKEVIEAPVVMMDGPLVITFANEPMQPNKVYVASSAINGIRDLSIATPEENYAEYSLHFLVGDIIDMFVFPSHFRWANGASPLIDANAYYELSIAAVKMNGEYIYKAVLTKF